MATRSIVERYVHTPPGSPSRSGTGTKGAGVDAAGAKVTGLRIETDSPAMWRASLRERTNTVVPKSLPEPAAATASPALLPALRPIPKPAVSGVAGDSPRAPSAGLPKWKAPVSVNKKAADADATTWLKSTANTARISSTSSSIISLTRHTSTTPTSSSRNTPTPSISYGKSVHRRIPSTSTYTPTPTRAPTPAPMPTDPASRRQRRYALAEAALARSASPHAHAPLTPPELQVRALEHATALLALHAQEARERVTQLKEADRSAADPAAWEAIQRERWRLEKRKGLVEEDAKVVNEFLVSLKRFGGRSRKLGGMGSSANTVSKGKVVLAGQEVPEKPSEDQARKQANLLRFFEISPTRTPISQVSRRKRATVSPSVCERRVTMDSSSPMRLRSSIVATFVPYGPAPPIRKPASGHVHGVTLPASVTPEGCTTNMSNSTKALVQPSSAVVEVTEDSHPSTSHFPKPVELLVADPNQDLEPHPEPSPTTPTSPGAGIAIIYTYKPEIPRSKADILAGASEVNDAQVEIPSYALELMGDFGRNLGENVSLQDSPSVSTDSFKDEAVKLKVKSPRPMSLGALPSRSRSLLRKPSLSGTRKPHVSMSAHRARPLSNLFAIAETAPASADREDTSAPVLSLSLTAEKLNLGMGIDTETQDPPQALPFPRQDTTPPRVSASSSFEIVSRPTADAVVKTPSKLRRRFSFLARK